MAQPSTETVSAILARHDVGGAWRILPATGIANYIYATEEVVLRIATDHPQARGDARTEVVAAPIARAAGIRVPRLLAFDHASDLVDAPYSIWERVHAETLCDLARPPIRIWRELGGELARLHDRVRECPDPLGWLDDPGREDSIEELRELVDRGLVDASAAAQLAGWLDQLRPATREWGSSRFLHDDVHAGNIMCTRDGAMVALIDWGDAGWGDPVLELAAVPIEAVPHVVDGYEAEGGELEGDVEARILFDQVRAAIDQVAGGRRDAIAALTDFVRTAEPRWRRLSVTI